MFDGWSLKDRMTILSKQINRLNSRLQGLKAATQEDTSRLEDAKDHLMGICDRLENDTDTLAAQLNDQFPVQDKWEQWAELNERFGTLSVDCLALEQSLALRKNEDIALLCTAADKLAEGFSKAIERDRSHFVLISGAEHFRACTSAIHLGYGHLDVWNLNRVAHEFGHLWALEVANGGSGPQEEFCRSLGIEPQTTDATDVVSQTANQSLIPGWKESHAREVFADIVAVFLMGPAYAMACFALDLNPADDRRSSTHPTSHERAHCILMALKELVQSYDPYDREELKKRRNQLCALWSAAREAAGLPAMIEEERGLRFAVEIAIRSLVKKISGAQYKNFAAAYGVRNALDDGRRWLPVEAKSIDVLNGAWLSRWDAGWGTASPVGRH